MPEQLDDATIERALVALAADLALPDEDAFTASVLAQLAPGAGRARPFRPRRLRGRRRWSIVVAAVLAAATATTLAIPDARAAVADWLGIDGVHLVRVDHLPPTTSTAPPVVSTTTEPGGAPVDARLRSVLGLEPEVSLESAAARLGLPGRRPTLAGLGPADLVGSGTAGRPVQLAQVWRTGASQPPSKALPDVAIVLSELQVGLGNGGFQKMLPRGATVEQVRVNGAGAWWITGDVHELAYFTADDRIVNDASRLAGDTLLWTVDGVTYRLESSLGRAGAIALAESLR
jgi:hypothetical protein